MILLLGLNPNAVFNGSSSFIYSGYYILNVFTEKPYS